MVDYIGHFSLWGDFQVEDITNLLGMQPSQVIRKGDFLEGASSPSTVSTWDLHCPLGAGQSMQEQISGLLNILWPKADVLKSLASQFHAELNVANSHTDGSAVLSLDHELLQKLAALHLKLNCFYIGDEVTNGD